MTPVMLIFRFENPSSEVIYVNGYLNRLFAADGAGRSGAPEPRR